ncbi:MAG TPA: hypothetical protein VFZ98_11315 [Vicinamibacterales bacterium]
MLHGICNLVPEIRRRIGRRQFVKLLPNEERPYRAPKGVQQMDLQLLTRGV